MHTYTQSIIKALLATLTCALMSGSSCNDDHLTDNARIYKAKISRVEYPTTEAELLKLVEESRSHHIPLIAAGKHHSQGGHSLCENGIVVDMTRFNKIVDINSTEKWIIVQSGTSWEKIQDAVNPLGLAVKVMQSSNIFTVGGSLSVNAHGRDPRFAALSSTVESIKVMTPDGHIRWIDRLNEAELFSLFVGGYGFFGFILEAKISLTDNYVLDKNAQVIDPENYADFVKQKIMNDDKVNLHFARFYVGNDAPLSKLNVVTYRSRPNKEISKDALISEKRVLWNKFLLNLLRKSNFVKRRSWRLQVKKEAKPETISRNNAMRPPILALDYHSKRDTDILQEYFIPVEHFMDFTRDIQSILKKHPMNLLNITIRYTKKNTDSLMPYAEQDCFAFVFYVNVGLSDRAQTEAKTWTQKLIDAALVYNGSFYLPYQRYATTLQLHKAYPKMPYVLEQKRGIDPDHIFQSDFLTYLTH